MTSAGAQQSSEALAVGRRAAVVGMAPAVMGLLHPLPSLAAAEQDKQAEIAALQVFRDARDLRLPRPLCFAESPRFRNIWLWPSVRIAMGRFVGPTGNN